MILADALQAGADDGCKQVELALDADSWENSHRLWVAFNSEEAQSLILETEPL